MAIAAARRLLATDPGDGDIRLGLAGLLIEDGDEKAGRAEVEVVHRLTPTSIIRVVVNVNPATR